MTAPSYLLPADAAEYVRLSGQTIQATATDQDGASSQHVLFLASEVVRSMLLADWIAPPPPVWDPLTADWIAAQAAYDARQAQVATEAAQLRQQIVQTAQSAVGVVLDQLTAAQRNALIACLLYRAGGVDAALKVRPLSEWIK